MPPRFSYWTIIAGGLPTAFRAADREELLPTFTRLKQKQPDAEMKWFARGKLWASPDEARAHAARRRDDRWSDERRSNEERSGQHRDGRASAQPDKPRETRGREWRPGGDHRDPRQPFKDAKKARNQRLKAEKFDRRSRRDQTPRERTHGDPLTPEPRTGQHGGRQGESAKGRRPQPRSAGHNAHSGDHHGWKPQGQRSSAPRRDWRDQATGTKRHGDKMTGPPPHRNRDGDQRDRPKSFDSRGKSSFDRRGKSSSEARGKSSFDPRGKSRFEAGGKSSFDQRGKSQFNARGKASFGPRGPSKFEARGKSSFGPRERSSVRPRDESHGDWRRDSPNPGRGTFRGEGHGHNEWKPRPPREQSGPAGEPGRSFAPKKFDRDRRPGSGSEEPSAPARPAGPNREPKPSEQPQPSPPPRPSEPITAPPGPPERGRLNRNKRAR